MEMYCWALVIGIVVYGISLYVGGKKGWLNQRYSSVPFIESHTTNEETTMDEYEEQT